MIARRRLAVVAVALWVALPALAEAHRLPAPVFEGWDGAEIMPAGLDDSEPTVRAGCAFVLGQTGDPHHADALAEALNDPDRGVRMWAGISLAWLRDKRGLHAARAAGVGTRWWMRYYALVALWRLGGSGLERDLAQGLRDPDPLVREFASAASTGEVEAWDEVAPPDTTPGEREPVPVLEEAAALLVAETDLWFHVGDYRQCLRAQEAALMLDATWVELYGVNGWVYWSLGRKTEALGAYRRGVGINPGDWSARFDLGQHYYLTGKYDAAAREFKRTRELACGAPLSHRHAHALEKAGRPAESLAVWRELAAEEPDDHIPPHHIKRLAALLEVDG
jgi:tetratricopeptide (TPR) repeat protein